MTMRNSNSLRRTPQHNCFGLLQLRGDFELIGGEGSCNIGVADRPVPKHLVLLRHLRWPMIDKNSLALLLTANLEFHDGCRTRRYRRCNLEVLCVSWCCALYNCWNSLQGKNEGDDHVDAGWKCSELITLVGLLVHNRHQWHRWLAI